MTWNHFHIQAWVVCDFSACFACMMESEKVVGEKSDSFHYGEHISIAELRCKLMEKESHGMESFSQATTRMAVLWLHRRIVIKSLQSGRVENNQRHSICWLISIFTTDAMFSACLRRFTTMTVMWIELMTCSSHVFRSRLLKREEGRKKIN